MRVRFPFLGISLAWTLLLIATGISAQKPNIILIISDDQSFNSIAYAGGDVFTPCIDSLAREGIRFSNAHVPSTVCSPSTGEAWAKPITKPSNVHTAVPEQTDKASCQAAMVQVVAAMLVSKAACWALPLS